uniref:Uncharacterized protein n=1 Tax=Arundo donax TaxID=35708 RepID=A0A0A8Y155_ARUDO
MPHIFGDWCPLGQNLPIISTQGSMPTFSSRWRQCIHSTPAPS